jgi:hypothetical protein
MADFASVQSSLQRLSTNQAAAQAYLRNPAAGFQAMGLPLPPGVTAAQLAQRLQTTSVHSSIVGASNGQTMSVQDWASCSGCTTVAAYILGGFGLVVGGTAGAVVAGPEEPIIAALAGIFGVTVSQFWAWYVAGVSGLAWAICAYRGQCP